MNAIVGFSCREAAPAQQKPCGPLARQQPEQHRSLLAELIRAQGGGSPLDYEGTYEEYTDDEDVYTEEEEELIEGEEAVDGGNPAGTLSSSSQPIPIPYPR